MSARRGLARAVPVLVLALAVTGVPRSASADEPSGSAAEEERESGAPDIGRRERPDYDGRADLLAPPEDIVLWIPRALLWPVHAVLEYVVRRPAEWVLTVGEHDHWDALQIPPPAYHAPSWGVVPTVLVDFGFLTSGGLYLWLDDIIARGNSLRTQVTFGGIDWLRAMIVDRVRVGAHGTVEIGAEGWMRPDLMFLGIGASEQSDRVSRYGRRQLGARVGLELRPWRASLLRLVGSVGANEMYDTTYVSVDDGQLTISDAIAQGWYPGRTTLPPGFDGYVAYRQTLELALDTREPAGGGSGVRIEGHAELALDLTSPSTRRWVRWGGALGGFLDVGAGRSLGLWLATDLASQLGPAEVPFTELPDLGGRGRMAAFRRGWLTGESIVSLSLEYRYPIWILVDGFVNVSTGNAFGPELQGFGIEHLRMSFATGLRTVGDPDQSFTLQIGLGTDSFANGFGPAIFRLTAGMQQGF